MNRDFLGGPVVKTSCFQCRGHGFHPLIRELRSHIPHRVALKKAWINNKVLQYRIEYIYSILCIEYMYIEYACTNVYSISCNKS